MESARERETVITIMVGLLVLYAILSKQWMWMTALGVGVAGILSRVITSFIHTTWFRISKKIGYVMSRIILGTLFVIVLLPIAFAAKLFRKDFMLIRKDYCSFFVERPHVYHREDLENPW